MAGYVQVSRRDIARLAKFLNLTVRQFEERHILKVNRKGEKLIKPGYDTCQFLGPDRRCTVYEARPTDCRKYVCWEANDTTVYEFARFVQMTPRALRRTEAEEASARR